MKNIAFITLALALASCSSKPLQKADLEYKVFPKVANYKYDFNLAIPQAVDARNEDFVVNNDQYFANPVAKSLSNIIFEEIRSTNSFNTVALLDQPISFSPTSAQIQEIRRSVGKDAIFLAQINKFNANVRKLSDTDTSNFVNLKVFTNITYKLILVDSETVIFLTTKDTSSDKTVPLDENIYRTINQLATNNIKENIIAAKNDFILTTKGTISGEEAKAQQQIKTLKIEKEFNLAEQQRQQEEAKKQQELEQKTQEPAGAEQTPVEQAQEQQANQEETPVENNEATEVATREEPIEHTASEQIEVPAETVTEQTAQELTQEVTQQAEEAIEKVTEVAEEVKEQVSQAVEETAEVVEEINEKTTEVIENKITDFTEDVR